MRFARRAIALLLSVSLASAPTIAEAAPKKPPAAPKPKKPPKTPPGPPPTAPAPPPPAAPSGPKPLADTLTGSAKTDYDAARALFTTSDYAAALAKYKAAHEASKDPRILWNMAACEKNLRHYAKTKRLLERYIDGDKALITPQDVTAAKELMAQVDPLIGKVTVTVSEAGATVTIDGEEVGTSPLDDKVFLDPGEHKIEVTRAGAAKYAKPIIVASGEQVVDVKMTLDSKDGKLTVQASAKDTITIDGKVVGAGSFSGPLPAGKHTLKVSAEGMKDYVNEVEIQDHQARSLHVTLEPNSREPAKGVPVWIWIAGGAVVAAGATTAVIVATRKDDTSPSSGVPGSIGPGSVRLPFGR